MKSRGALAVGWLIVVATLWVTPVGVYSLDAAQEREDSRVKALFITHLFSFISWPDGHQAERICATQTSTLSEVLEEVLATKPGLKVTLSVVSGEDRSALATCNIWLLEDVDDLIRLQTNRSLGPVLTIGDQQGFAERGGMIELARRSSRVTLIINRDHAEAAGFSISSKLLRLARIVRTSGARNE